MKNWQDELKRKVKDHLRGYTACHDYYHALRVLNNAIKISAKIKCDHDVLFAGALLHDVGYKNHEKDDKNHYKYSMRLAKRWLVEVGFSKEKIPSVLEAIRLHDNFHWDINGEKTKHLETKVIQDADRIDALGAIGIARIVYYHGEKGYPIYNPDQVKKTKKVWLNHSVINQIERDPIKKWQNLNFEYSKILSKERYNFLNLFLKTIKQEINDHDVR